MKANIVDNKEYMEILITPETPQEVTVLARYAQNAKAQKPYIYMSLNEYPKLDIVLHKIKPANQVLSITPYKRKK